MHLILAAFFALIACRGFVLASAKDKVLVVVSSKNTTPVDSLIKHFPPGVKSTVLEYNKNVLLVENEELLYGSVAIAVPFLEDPKDDLHVAKLVDFVNRGGNVLLLVNPDISSHWREFAKEFGVTFEDPDSYVIDHHQNYQSNPLLIKTSLPLAVVTSGKPIIFGNAIGHSLKKSNPLLAPVLQASETAYSASLTGKARKGTLSGNAIGLVSVSQARNNARVTFIGSLDVFQEKYQTNNGDFLKAISAWTFSGVGSLRIDSVVHGKNIGPLTISNASYISPSKYRIKDEIEYFVKVSVLGNDGKWTPYSVPKNDNLQLEVTMLSPYYRINLKKTSAVAGVYTTEPFQLPDTYGVFSFVLTHIRSGLGRLEFKQKVVILPFRHDEYERFIPAAFPYYANVFSCMVGFFCLLLVVFYGKEPKISKGTKRD